MTLDFDTCYRAVLARDPRFDGRFFTAVTSTGIYCRPVCPARTPARANMRFFPHPGAAEAAGFRACRRCRPETSPGSPEWNARADLGARAVRLIAAGYVDEHGIGGLAARLAVTQRHLHRLLVAELGTGPLALARTVRLQTARRLLAETSLPITDIAFASGFSSVRQFNATVLESSRRTPSQLRAAARGARRPEDQTADGPGTWLTLRLACREPYDAAALLDFLAVRAVPGVEQATAGVYSRTVRTAGGAGLIELLPRPGKGHVLLRARLGKLGGIGPLVARCRRLLDADADPAAIGTALAADDLIAPLVRARPGLRVPGCYDGFELAVRAVLGQQVSVAAARTFAARLAARHGTPLPADMVTDGASATVATDGLPAGQPGPHLLFPGPEELAGADLAGLGLTMGRQRTLGALAAAAASGRLDLSLGADPEETAARLAELPGIGPWTISYIMLRTGADPDAFPATDLGLRRALARLGASPGHPGRWRPWRGYAAQHLWTWEAATAGADHLGHPRSRTTRGSRPSRPGRTTPRSRPRLPAPGAWQPGETGVRRDGFPIYRHEEQWMPDTILATTVDTPIGPLSLLACAEQLIAGGFTADPAGLHGRLHPSLRGLARQAARPGDLPWLVKPVGDYFDGDLTALDGLATRQPGSAGRQRLWAAMRAVPAGAVLSYAALATQAGNPRASRAAGAACAANLVAPVIPCHRIVRSDGSLGGYYYGLDRKAWLLRHEGALPA